MILLVGLCTHWRRQRWATATLQKWKRPLGLVSMLCMAWSVYSYQWQVWTNLGSSRTPADRVWCLLDVVQTKRSRLWPLSLCSSSCLSSSRYALRTIRKGAESVCRVELPRQEYELDETVLVLRLKFVRSASWSLLSLLIWLIWRLAGPALFRGRLRAFGKCTNGVAFSKGRPNLASVRLTL